MRSGGRHERWLCRKIADQTPHAHNLQMALRVQNKGEKKEKNVGGWIPTRSSGLLARITPSTAWNMNQSTAKFKL
jgi:hypothetical protein